MRVVVRPWFPVEQSKASRFGNRKGAGLQIVKPKRRHSVHARSQPDFYAGAKAPARSRIIRPICMPLHVRAFQTLDLKFLTIGSDRRPRAAHCGSRFSWVDQRPTALQTTMRPALMVSGSHHLRRLGVLTPHPCCHHSERMLWFLDSHLASLDDNLYALCKSYAFPALPGRVLRRNTI
jgi:hypothetical protein